MGLELYIGDKVKGKSRRYNTKNNRHNLPSDNQAVAENAAAYQRAKSGDDGNV
jgi:hypothetical protein